LNKRTSINSQQLQLHKEKEMADFRKWIYALAVVALLAGFTVPVSAQAPPFQCIANAGVPPIVRAEGYTEQVGDLTLNCNGGVPTPAGLTVPPVNVTILLSTNITSRLLTTTGFNEALLIIDEPHSAVNPARNILNCGASGAPDTGISGPGVCAITSIGAPALTYDGTKQGTYFGGAATVCSGPGGTGVVPSADTYGCGRPNVFQGRQGTQQNPGQFNSTVFLGVPLDPPGTTTNRTIRITNVRANAVAVGVANTFTTSNITMNISINGNTSIAINNPQQLVAYVQRGLVTTVTGKFDYLQCNSVNPLIYGLASATSPALQTLGIRFTEGFASSFKVKNIAHTINEAGNNGNGKLQPGASYWQWASASGPSTSGAGYTSVPTNYPNDVNQNVPGAIYNTESGFEYPGTIADPASNGNPPDGVGTQKVTSTANALANAYTTTGIAGAGIANQGTRLALNFSSIPNGSQVFVPSVAFLFRQGSHCVFPLSNFNCGSITGVAVLTNTDANGAGSYSRANTGGSTTFVAVGSSNLAVYEVLWADPFSLEDLDVPIALSYVANLAQNLPAPGVKAQLAGGFAPFYTTAAAGQPSSTLPIPRFTPGTIPSDLYLIVKCACNLLFPYVVSTAGYDTGIAIANASTDPGATFGFGATPQAGAVQFWYYGVGANNSAPPATQCTNTASPGACPGTTVVPTGQVMTYVASSGSQQWGLDNRAAGFVGYVITQAAFQYCHAFAYVSALGAGPLTPGTSEGYLGLLLDNTGVNCIAPGVHNIGLCRTTQSGENLVH
jgi:hypothetical protein